MSGDLDGELQAKRGRRERERPRWRGGRDREKKELISNKAEIWGGWEGGSWRENRGGQRKDPVRAVKRKEEMV